MHATDAIEAELTAERVLTAPLRARTYGNLAYLALAFPLGVAYFVGATIGLSLGTSLLITLVGVPILLATLFAAVLVAGFEARLATALVGVNVPLPAVLREEFGTDSEGVVETLKQALIAPTTWTSVLLLFVKFAFGIAAFTLLVTVGAIVGVSLGAPLLYDQPGTTYTVGAYAIESLPAALALAAFGVVLGWFAFTAVNLLAIVGAVLTAVLLGVESGGDGEGDIDGGSDGLTRAGESSTAG